MKKIRVLFYGDGPQCATGFATISRNVLPALYNTGKYDFTILGINYFGEPNLYQKYFEMYPIRTMSKNQDPYGRQVSAELMRDLQYDIIFMIQDSFIMSFMDSALPQLHARGKRAPVVMYYPVDGTPKPEWIKSMANADVPVTYTEYGRTESIKACPEIKSKLLVIPHGTNVEDFKPMPEKEVLEFRKSFFHAVADKFIMTNVSRNQPRKDIPRSLMAFKEFKKMRPNSVYYAHCAAQDFGWDMVELCRSLGLKIDHDVLLPKNFGPNQGYPVEILNMIYNASDVMVSSCWGEGWGLMATEAMACKKPIIMPANTSMLEIVGEDRGFLVKSGNTLNNWAVHSNDNDVLRPLVDIEDMIETMLHVHDNPDEAKKRATNGYRWVTSNLIWEKHIVPQWDKVLTKALEKSYSAPAPAAAKTIISGDEL